MAIRLYTTRDNTGAPVSYNDACSALPDGLNDRTLSLQTDAGESWQVWTDVGYSGTASPILSGTYGFDALLRYGLVHADGKGRISSLQRVPRPAEVGSITLYQGTFLDGVSRSCSTAAPELGSGWNDATRSCEVTGAPWIVYVDNNYTSSAAALAVGRYNFDALARVDMVHAKSGAGRISSLRPLASCPEASWMSRVRGDVLLSELTIPGTHDSCTYVGTLAVESRCQSMGIREQLIAGIRYIDLRPKLEGRFLNDPAARLPIHHSKLATDATHIDLQDVIDDCAAFLAASPGETIVVSIKNADPHSDNMQWFVNILQRYLSQSARLWYLDEALPALGDVRGKLVLFRQFDLPDGTATAKWGLPVDIGWGGSDGNHRDDFTIDCGSWRLRGQDNYSDANNKWDHIQPMLEAAAATPSLATPAPQGGAKPTLFVNYTSTVSDGGIPSVFADLMNPCLCDYLRKRSQGRRLGIIPMDFPGEAIGRLIDRNRFLAPNVLPPRMVLKAANGQYVCAEGGGGGVVVANRAQAAAWETFEVCVFDAPSGKIGLRCADGRFVSVEVGGSQTLVANRPELAAGETLTARIVDKTKGLISLQAWNGKYVQSTGVGGSALTASANEVSSAATFKLEVPAALKTSMPNKIFLRASNGLYVCAENGGGGALVADRGTPAAWETFTVVPVDAAKGQYGLQASNSQFVCAENGGGGTLVANRSVRALWETFTIYELAGNQIALKASGGQFVQADNGGGAGLSAISGFSLSWETFTLVPVS